ncbi:hypothetical protein CLHUN_18460 [Ruminiclostridium hungatei]|uniref:Uncharacterized protein n=1 Tax=Ruminiclostridium hungatei TaxID=48256 RepID=A0A1V4SK61_RUMHU|nr:YciC family protein [Ruminiclostridium hungatei]OPX44292.1 hypothetical protein CLHUN_18460 [Ruminiclostridium hungatei]
MNDTSGVKRFFEYLPACIRFHKLKSEGLARLIFLLVLLFQMAGSYIQYKILNQISSEDLDFLQSAIAMPSATVQNANSAEKILFTLLMVIVANLVIRLITNLFLSVYMYSYISELKGKTSGIAASFKGAFRNFGRLVVYNILFGLLVLMGLIFFVIPGIIAYIIFIFGFCYILDLKLNVADAFTASSELTKRRKMQIVSVFMGFYLMFELPIVLLISGSTLGSAYLASFFSTIAGIILQRLITQLYMDMEYKKERTGK